MYHRTPRNLNAIVFGWLLMHTFSSLTTFGAVWNGNETYAQTPKQYPALNQSLYTDLGPGSNATMKKPCTLYLKMVNLQKPGRANHTKGFKNIWMCELSLDDRVSLSYRSYCIAEIKLTFTNNFKNAIEQPKLAYHAHIMVVIQGLPTSFLDSIGAKSGFTTLFSPLAIIKTERILFSNNNTPVVGERLTQNRRQLAPRTTGQRTILFVRVIAPDGSTTPSQNDISNKAFGTFGETESLRTGFTRCSYNQLLMSPAQHTLANNGVIDVSISQTVQGTSDDTVWNAAEQVLNTKLNVQDLGTLFDHVVYCLPSGTTSFLAYAYMASWRSVFSDSWCLNPGVLMHELGHNLNLGHSSELMGEYGDSTCQMGGNNWPQCFNGAKSFQLGWYGPRTVTTNLLTTTMLSPTSYTLVGTSDYQNTNNIPSALVILKLETGDHDYFVAFNRKKGINAGVGEYGDLVLITKQNDGGDNSRLIAHLSSSNSMLLTTVSIGTSVYDIKIDVNTISLDTDPGKAIVTVSRTLSNVSYSNSQLYGGSGGSDYSGICPSGSKIKSVSGWGDGSIGSLIVFCDNGSMLGPFGNGGGTNVVGQDCTSGLTGVTVTYGIYIGKIEPLCGSTKLSPIGTGQGNGSGQSVSFTCPGTQKLVGVRGKSGGLLDSVRFLCADIPEVVSDMYGGAGGSYYYSQKCPPGKKIINMSGRGGSWVDQLVAQCDDGSYVGPIGGTGGGPVVANACTGGYIGGTITYGTFVGKVSLVCSSSGSGTVIGGGWSYGSGQSGSFQCPTNQVIIGIRGKASDYVDSASFICGSTTAIAKPTPKPTALIIPTPKPIPNPTVKPTVKSTEFVTNMYGGAGGSFYSKKCPPGKKIINLSGRGGLWVDQLVAQCEDGSNVGPIGGTGGGPVVADTCSGGYIGGNITYGTYVGMVSLLCSSSRTVTAIGGGLSSGSGKTASFQCPINQVIVGLSGMSGIWVDSVGFICGRTTTVAKPSAKPTTKPTPKPAKPTSLPSKKPSARPSTRPSAKPTAKPTIKPTQQSISFRITNGPIRSMLGQCIDVNAFNFVSGVQLQMWDCNGGRNQFWSRPNATDLRLMTSNNLCMDAAGNAGSGGSVLIQPCSSALSQQWIFDGRNLRPMHNNGLCLSINGGATSNGTKLIVWPCDNSSSSAWSEYSLSSIYGTPNASGSFIHQLCPVGSKLTTIAGRGGSLVDQISGICDDSAKTALGPFGGTGGGAVTIACGSAGFIGMNVTSGTSVGKVVAQCSGSTTTSTSSIGAGLLYGCMSGFQLSGDQRIIGLHVQSGQYVNAISFLYSSTRMAATSRIHTASRA